MRMIGQHLACLLGRVGHDCAFPGNDAEWPPETVGNGMSVERAAMAGFYAIRHGNARNHHLAGKPVSRQTGDGSAWGFRAGEGDGRLSGEISRPGLPAERMGISGNVSWAAVRGLGGLIWITPGNTMNN